MNTKGFISVPVVISLFVVSLWVGTILTPSEPYKRIGDLNGVTVVLCPQECVQAEYEALEGTQLGYEYLGFYRASEKTIYSIYDERVLGHEVLHALGYSHDVGFHWQDIPVTSEDRNE